MLRKGGLQGLDHTRLREFPIAFAAQRALPDKEKDAIHQHDDQFVLNTGGAAGVGHLSQAFAEVGQPPKDAVESGLGSALPSGPFLGRSAIGTFAMGVRVRVQFFGIGHGIFLLVPPHDSAASAHGLRAARTAGQMSDHCRLIVELWHGEIRPVQSFGDV